MDSRSTLPDGFALFKRETLFSTSEVNRKCAKKSNHLRDIFKKYKGVESNLEIKVTLTLCKEIFVNELEIDYENLSYLMKYALSECLCFYLQIWNGWTDSSSTLQELKSYVTSKIKFIVDHHKKFCKPAKNLNDLECLKLRNDEDIYSLTVTGAQSKVDRPVKPYAIEDNEEQPEWLPISLQEFLNYPGVSVEINLPYLQIRRSCLLGYERHVCSDETNFDDLKPKGDPKKIISKKIESPVYWRHPKKDVLDFIVKFLQLTKLYKDKIHVFLELGIIFEEFALDLTKFDDGDTFEIPGSVGYRYCEEFYVRNKRVVHKHNKTTDPEPLNYKEVVIPQVIIALLKFKPQTNLVSTAKQKKRFVDQVNDSITFSCLHCSANFTKRDGFLKLMEHFRSHHKPETAFSCSKCSKKTNVFNVLENRWIHNC